MNNSTENWSLRLSSGFQYNLCFRAHAQELKLFFVDSDKKLVEGVINQLIQWFYEINFANGEVPVFELNEPEDVDLTLAQRDKILSDTGVKFTKEYFIKNYGLEDEDFDIILLLLN